VEAIKRQTRYACGGLAVCGLSLQRIGCTPALYVTQSAAAAAVRGLWRYISVEPLPSTLTLIAFISYLLT